MVTQELPYGVIEVREYVDFQGTSPYGNWLKSLDVGPRARVITAILRVERGNFADAKSVGAGVSELRLDFGPGDRVYFGRDGEKLVILLGGGSKRKQQTDIQRAQAYWAEYMRRKRVE
jgi:putative addiction module killer protein